MPKGHAVGGPNPGSSVGDNYGSNTHSTTPAQNFVPEAILPQPRQYSEDFADQYASTTDFASSRVPIRVMHGPGKCAGTIIYAKVFNGQLLVVYLFGWGKLKSVTNIKIGGKTQAEIFPAYWHFYDGSQAPFSTVDATMAAMEPKWLSCMPKMAYLVVKFNIPSDVVPYVDWQDLQCDYEGLYCRDHRADPTLVTRYYTTNNALIRADIWTNKHYGYKRADAKVDWDTVDTAANDCDDVISGLVRFRMGSRFETQRTVDVIEEQMRLHAQMFDGINAAGQYQMFVDKVRAASAVVLTDQGADRTIVAARLRGKEPNECPNRIAFNFTNSVKDYKPDTVTTEKIGIGTGLVPDVVTATYDTPWCLDWYIAKNLSIWAYNRSNLPGMDEEAEIETFYRGGVRCVPGLIITVTSRALAWVSQLAIVRTVSRNGLGWKITVEPYSAAIYSNVALDQGTVINQPAAFVKYPVPNPVSVTLTEYNPVEQDGATASFLLCTFVAADYSYLSDHIIKVTRTKAGEPTTFFETHGFKGPVLVPRTADKATYVATIYTINTDGVRSAGLDSAPLTTTVKIVVPADVLGLRGGTNGTQAFLWWQTSADRDIRGYEIRRGTSSDTWLTALYIAQTNVASWSDEPPFGGAVRYFIKAMDWAGRYSANAATFDITLSVIGNAFTTEEWELLPYASAFTRVAPGADAQTGMWYGSGNLILDVMPSRDTVTGYYMTAFLTRTFSPATAETERSAGGHTTVGAWATVVDDPRRGGAPLWAPLPAGAAGEIYTTRGTGQGKRQRETRAVLAKIEHSGSDVPATLALVQPLFMDDILAPTVKHYGNVFQTSPLATERAIGIRLSSNAYNYQQIVRDSISPEMFGIDFFRRRIFTMTKENKPCMFLSGVATTDAVTGLFTLSYTYPLAVSGKAWLSIDCAPAGLNFGVILIDAVDTLAQTVRFKSYDSAGVMLPSFPFNYKLTDNGGVTNFVVWI